MSDTPVLQTPQQRLDAAHKAFDQVNQTLPAGMMPFGLPQEIDLAAGLDGLVRTLIDTDVITEDAFVAAKINAKAGLIEQMTEQAREMKRQAMGLAVASAMPQGIQPPRRLV